MRSEALRIAHRVWSKTWRLANPEKVAAIRKKWREANPAKYAQQNREYMRRSRLRNPDAHRERNRAHRRKHLEVIQARQRAAYAANREAIRFREQCRKFGLTKKQYQAIYDKQGGLCAICKQNETSKRNGRIKRLAVDHDHSTEKVRGLLCGACNAGIGQLKENPEILRVAANYLESGGTL